jgi:predicted acylesterase/phospholipase RssA/WD40 repeat protein
MSTSLSYGEYISALNWSADGSRLFSASYDGKVRVWQTDVVNVARNTPNDDVKWKVLAMDWSAKRADLIIVGGAPPSSLSAPALFGETISAADVRCSPTSNLVALREIVWMKGELNIFHAIRVRDLDRPSDSPIFEISFPDKGSRICDFAWTPNGEVLAVMVDGEVTLQLMDQSQTSTGKWKLGQWANTMAWLTNDELAVAYCDGTIRIFDRNDFITGDYLPKCKKVIEEHDSSIVSISVGMAGNQFAAIDLNGCICVWNKSHELIAKHSIDLRDSQEAVRLALNPCFPVLAYAHGTRFDFLPIDTSNNSKQNSSREGGATSFLDNLLQACGLPRPRTLTSEEIKDLFDFDTPCNTAEEFLQQTKQLRRIAKAFDQIDLLICAAVKQIWAAPTKDELLALKDIELQTHHSISQDATRYKIFRLFADASSNPDAGKRTIAICAYTLFALGGYQLLPELDANIFRQRINSIGDHQLRRQLKRASIASYDQSLAELADNIEQSLTAIARGLRDVAVKSPQKTIDEPHHVNDDYALVMKGGGMKGLACVGALSELQRFYHFDLYVGTSAGAIIAALLGAGYTANEMETILRAVNFADFLGERFKTVTNLLFHGGLFRGTELSNWIDSLLAKKLKSPSRVKFRQLPYQVRIYSCRRDTDALIFDSSHSPQISVAHAVRCSVAIPLFFTPERDQGLNVFDGGMRHNYPVKKLLEQTPDKKFIGLYLGDPIYTPRNRSIIRDLISISTEATDVEALETHRTNTIIIDPSPISTLDFSLSPEEKTFLLSQGRAAALDFLYANGRIEQAEVSKAIELATQHKVAALAARRKRTSRRKLVVGMALAAAISLGLLWNFATSGTILHVDKTALPSLPAREASTPADIFRQARASVGTLSDASRRPGTTVGTCFIVRNDGYALTAAHVVKDALGGLTVTLGSTAGKTYKASIVKVDENLDLAVIKLSGTSDFSLLKISRETVQVGDLTNVVGFALDQDISLLTGSVASMNFEDRFVTVAAQVSPGMAGAPVLDKNGDVVGIIRGGFADRSAGIVIPSRLARGLLTGIIPD